MAPAFTSALTPWYLNGSLLDMSRVPFIPPDPYSAEEAPGSSSILSTSREERPTTDPTEKLRPGAWLSIPSTNWLNRAFPLPLKPRVVKEVKVRLEEVTSTPLMVRMI